MRVNISKFCCKMRVTTNTTAYVTGCTTVKILHNMTQKLNLTSF